MRQGVSPSSLALPSLRQPPWGTVLDALAALLPRISAAEWHARMSRGQVLDDAGTPLPPDAPYQRYQRIHYWRELPEEQAIPFRHTVLFRDEHLLVADKPHYLPVTPGGRFVQETLLVRLKHELGLPDLSPLHRLDRETAGVVAFCLRPQDRDAYQRLFRERRVHKVYEAVAPWRENLTLPLTRSSTLREDEERFYRMRELPPAFTAEAAAPPNATTRVELITRLAARHHNSAKQAPHAELALYRLHPVTGKRHQLRVHMAALGLPILHDQFYPEVSKAPGEWEDFNNPPLQLLGRELSFTDPVTGDERRFVSGRQLAAAADQHLG